MSRVNRNYIDGQWLDSTDGKFYEHNNPADLTQVTGVWPESTVECKRRNKIVPPCGTKMCHSFTSGCVEDFHVQVVRDARHTTKETTLHLSAEPFEKHTL